MSTAALLLIGAGSGRVAVPIGQAPWRGLARVQTELGERCTGFLIAPDVAVTAAHCLFLPRVGHFIRPDSVHVLLRYSMGRFAAEARVARFVIASSYDPRREQATASADRAVLLLDHAIGGPGDAIALAHHLPAVGERLLLAGYGQDRDELAVRGPPCRITSVLADAIGGVVIAHDCAATLGTSGAPLLAPAGDGTWRAVGVQIEARVGALGGRAAWLLGAATRSGSSSGR
ncbi:trypsin-like serine peptidase [Lichenicoccus sp.]|uniref:trypsin-like serine peptidase n=1 Tax=Lichenicoccus sp. TaxID=2781899 RepID=UPI003D0BE9CD